MIRFLFKQPQPKRFMYRPRFYDETREYIEARKAAIRKEVEAEKSQAGGIGFQSQMQHQWRSGHHRRTIKTSNRNVLLIFLLLLAAAYIFLYR